MFFGLEKTPVCQVHFDEVDDQDEAKVPVEEFENFPLALDNVLVTWHFSFGDGPLQVFLDIADEHKLIINLVVL